MAADNVDYVNTDGTDVSTTTVAVAVVVVEPLMMIVGDVLVSGISRSLSTLFIRRFTLLLLNFGDGIIVNG
jgi:hypothetical protein